MAVVSSISKGVETMQHGIDEHYEMLRKLAFTYVKDTALAQDIVQDVCVKLIEKAISFEESQRIRLI